MSGSLRSKLEVFIWRHVVYIPKSWTTFRGILICAIFRPGICKNTIRYSGSSQGIQVYNTYLFSISPEPISNTRLFIVYLFCVLHTYHYASFTRECHGTAALQAQTTSIYDVIGHRSILFLPRLYLKGRNFKMYTKTITFLRNTDL